MGHNAGIRNPRARLTPRSVAEIRADAASGMSQADIARKYGVGQQHVSRILCGKRWPTRLDEAVLPLSQYRLGYKKS